MVSRHPPSLGYYRIPGQWIPRIPYLGFHFGGPAHGYLGYRIQVSILGAEARGYLGYRIQVSILGALAFHLWDPWIPGISYPSIHFGGPGILGINFGGSAVPPLGPMDSRPLGIRGPWGFEDLAIHLWDLPLALWDTVSTFGPWDRYPRYPPLRPTDTIFQVSILGPWRYLGIPNQLLGGPGATVSRYPPWLGPWDTFALLEELIPSLSLENRILAVSEVIPSLSLVRANTFAVLESRILGDTFALPGESHILSDTFAFPGESHILSDTFALPGEPYRTRSFQSHILDDTFKGSGELHPR
ncbi:hypothetical protein AMTR_s00070p00035980 [Amborella trichopoda]|uniref:Uncharacterized protein n=1 Tax=Amborella trichopoda TaxID=13333 RepID=U5DDG4_AMBTC|nr:hypothetical protein AMTR_s00070p00035980 [Amborella trichopoda]